MYPVSQSCRGQLCYTILPLPQAPKQCIVYIIMANHPVLCQTSLRLLFMSSPQGCLGSGWPHQVGEAEGSSLKRKFTFASFIWFLLSVGSHNWMMFPLSSVRMIQFVLEIMNAWSDAALLLLEVSNLPLATYCICACYRINKLAYSKPIMAMIGYSPDCKSETVSNQ